MEESNPTQQGRSIKRIHLAPCRREMGMPRDRRRINLAYNCRGIYTEMVHNIQTAIQKIDKMRRAFPGIQIHMAIRDIASPQVGRPNTWNGADSPSLVL